jgi:hypothetical protein
LLVTRLRQTRRASEGQLVRRDVVPRVPPRRGTDGIDPVFADDVQIIITSVVYALMGQVAAGEISGDEIMPTIERVLRRLTYDV